MRTRFAPSPTGFLHVGGLRTALFAYILAYQTKGSFLLRIEDTDRARSVEGAVENILATLHWAGLHPDEGVMLRDGMIVQNGDKGPYVQSERKDLYARYARDLIASGHAYYAFDTPEEIEAMKKELTAEGHASPNYSSVARMRMKNSLSLGEEETKRRIAASEPYVIRFKMPENEVVSFDDDVRGNVEFRTKLLDDQVLLKSDGFPTYHLAHVVDDHLMDIDIVIRGEEWLSSLPKHVLLFRALGWEPPRYAHVPLLLNKDRTKLSKRQSDVAAEEYIAKGYLPEALVNFLALLGWNPGTEQELFSLRELIDSFSLDRVQKAGAVFDTEKLDWLQGQWMRRIPLEEFAERTLALVAERFPAARKDENFAKKAALIQDRVTFLHESPDMLAFFYEEPTVTKELLAEKKQKVTPELLPDLLSSLLTTLETIDDAGWNEESIAAVLGSLLEERGWKRGQLLWPLRAALTGKPFSPGAYEVAAVLGKEKTLERLRRAQVPA